MHLDCVCPSLLASLNSNVEKVDSTWAGFLFRAQFKSINQQMCATEK